MSSIGPGNIGAFNLVGSFAGAQRADADADRAKAESADRKFQVDQREFSAHSLDDVTETELSSDRDADGRQLYSDVAGQPDAEHGELPDEDSTHSAGKGVRTDAFGERGRLLDLEA